MTLPDCCIPDYGPRTLAQMLTSARGYYRITRLPMVRDGDRYGWPMLHEHIDGDGKLVSSEVVGPLVWMTWS